VRAAVDENDIAATSVSFGFNSALSFTIEMLDRSARRPVGAQDRRGGGPGDQTGWLALRPASPCAPTPC